MLTCDVDSEVDSYRISPQAKDAAWTKCINLAPKNAAAWSNRGTVRLQYAKWELAYADFMQAYTLEEETGQVSSQPDCYLCALWYGSGADLGV